MVMEDGMQSVVPPLIGTNAFARMEYRTSPAAGEEYEETFPEEKIPTLGLLAGSIRVYCAQFVFAGALDGHPVDESRERFIVEIPSAGMVTGKL
jgi:hypothetical protein